MNKLTLVLVCSALTLLAIGVQGQTKASSNPKLTPERIIAKMAKTYATCKSYQDNGTVKTVLFQDKGKNIAEKPFTTAFIRPDQFRFEYKKKVDSYIKEKPCYIVWRKGAEVSTWFFVRDIIEKGKSFNSAIAGATGVSGGSARRIPALLLPEITGRKLSAFKELKMLKDAKFDNVNCFRIQGKFISSCDMDILVRKPSIFWIEKDRFLIRRVDEGGLFINNGLRTETTTIYYPSLNQSIPDKMLEFAPPGGSKMLKRATAVKKSPKTKKSATGIFMDGYCSSAKQAAKEEQKLLKNPDDPDTVTKLLGYFESRCRKDDAARKKRDKYFLWMIEHHPDAAILAYDITQLHARSKVTSHAAKKLWLEQVKKHPKNPQVLWNAAKSVYHIDKKLAEQFYKKGQALEPENLKWTINLARYYFGSKQPEKALNEYRKLYPKSKDNVYIVLRTAKSAFDCGKIQEAQGYAIEMQRLAEKYKGKNEKYEKLLFNANLILGRIALKQGKVEEAGKYLLKAARTPVSLKSMPDFTLAKDLLAAEQKNIVLQFLQSCSRFWNKTLCDKWIKQINEAKIPDFKYKPYRTKKL